jgi:hypothetical protein
LQSLYCTRDLTGNQCIWIRLYRSNVSRTKLKNQTRRSVFNVALARSSTAYVDLHGRQNRLENKIFQPARSFLLTEYYMRLESILSHCNLHTDIVFVHQRLCVDKFALLFPHSPAFLYSCRHSYLLALLPPRGRGAKAEVVVHKR